jgi:hypothetical protein
VISFSGGLGSRTHLNVSEVPAGGSECQSTLRAILRLQVRHGAKCIWRPQRVADGTAQGLRQVLQ